ncbi:MAG: hypothetical protein QOH58_3220 [Thermoleophilaceae bacterium]|jgi:hypothetical protein|nr:hypothetical protein [Thermoleophilaceae bacterium]
MDFAFSRSRIMLAALAGAAVLMLVGAAGAQAKLLELTGSTTVTPSEQATQFLADHGVSVAPVGQAVAEEGSFVFPIAAGFGNSGNFNGLLAHSGGLKFTKGDRSAVLRRFVAVRAGRTAVLLAQIPGLRGGCGHVRQALRQFAATHPRAGKAARKHPKATRHLLKTLGRYCNGGRVIVLARLTNLGKDVGYNSALLTADLELSRQAARLLNRLAGGQGITAGAPLGTAESRVTVVTN